MVDQDEPESTLEHRSHGASPQQRKLELARADVVRRLEVATNDRLRQMLKSALADLDDQLKKVK